MPRQTPLRPRGAARIGGRPGKQLLGRFTLTTESIGTAKGQVTVTAHARLHMGFMDMHGGLGRQFGSLGVALSGIRTRVRLHPAAAVSAEGPAAGRAAQHARQVLEALGLDGGVALTVEEAIPEHMGLGSGTQLALAVAAGIASLYDQPASPRELASVVDRGARSGIGLGAFEQGGFLVDAGHGPGTVTPPLICRLPFPQDWRLLLVVDRHCQGLSGMPERQAFKDMAPMPAEVAGELCRLTLMQILPALLEDDVARFGAGITRIQEAVGDHFATYQGGRFTSPRVAAALVWMRARPGVHGIGQSSWGPTGFAVVGSEAAGRRVLADARAHCPGLDTLELMLCRGWNAGAELVSEPARRAAPIQAVRS